MLSSGALQPLPPPPPLEDHAPGCGAPLTAPASAVSVVSAERPTPPKSPPGGTTAVDAPPPASWSCARAARMSTTTKDVTSVGSVPHQLSKVSHSNVVPAGVRTAPVSIRRFMAATGCVSLLIREHERHKAVANEERREAATTAGRGE